MVRTLDENLALFTELANHTLSTVPSPTTRDFVDGLIEAGADPTAIQFGADATTKGETSDATFWALQIGEKCLIGEYHPREVDPDKPKIFTTVLAQLRTGCLFGTPHTIQ